jgi:hypothetical protein
MKNFLKTLWLATVISLSSCNGYNDNKWWVEKKAQANITEVMNDKKEVVDDQTHHLLQWLVEMKSTEERKDWTLIVRKIIKGTDFQDWTIELSKTVNGVWQDVIYNFNTREFSWSYNEKGKWWKPMTDEDCIDLMKEFTDQPLG